MNWNVNFLDESKSRHFISISIDYTIRQWMKIPHSFIKMKAAQPQLK